MSENTLNLIKENEVRWVDLRFTDTRGKEQHVPLPAKEVKEEFFESGKMFDGSSIGGWKGICLLYTSPSPRDRTRSRMPSSA